VGVFNGHREVSYKEQLQLVRDIRRIENPLNEILEGRLLYQNRHFNHRTRVIYTGIDINEIANLNTSDSSFTADFYIWFRTDVELDPAQIEFLNTVEPIVLDEPIIQKENEDGLVTYTFRVRSNFRGDFNFYRYPFDSQELPIRFKHRVMTRDQLIFVPDVLGMRIGDGYGKTQEASLQTISGWDYDGSLFYQDDISNSSSLGVEDFFEDSYALEYSRFNATVVIARDATSFILKNLFPMLFVMLLAYVPFYITNFAPRLNMVASSLLTAAFFHLKLSSGIAVGYLVAIEYFFFGVYFLIGLAVIESIVAHRLVENAGNAGEDKERLLAIFHKLDWISRASFPVLTILIVYLVIVSFDGFSSF
jgi:branched-chain amino acid transport system substrate-binding protein